VVACKNRGVLALTRNALVREPWTLEFWRLGGLETWRLGGVAGFWLAGLLPG